MDELEQLERKLRIYHTKKKMSKIKKNEKKIEELKKLLKMDTTTVVGSDLGGANATDKAANVTYDSESDSDWSESESSTSIIVPKPRFGDRRTHDLSSYAFTLPPASSATLSVAVTIRKQHGSTSEKTRKLPGPNENGAHVQGIIEIFEEKDSECIKVPALYLSP